MPKRGPPSQLVAEFGNAFGDHFRAKQLSPSTLKSQSGSIYLAQSILSDLDLGSEKASDRSSGIVPSRQSPLCLYFRAYKKGGYVGDDDIYYAAYLRERTSATLMKIICTKLSVDYVQVKKFIVMGIGEADVPLSDTFVNGLRAEQTLDIEVTPESEDEMIGSLRMSIRL